MFTNASRMFVAMRYVIEPQRERLVSRRTGLPGKRKFKRLVTMTTKL